MKKNSKMGLKLLMITGAFLSCTSSQTTGENLENEGEETVVTDQVSEEPVAENGVIEVEELMAMGYDDDGTLVGQTLTVKGWFCSLNGKVGTDEKMLYLGSEKEDSGAPLQITIAGAESEKLAEATVENQITVKVKITELGSFGVTIMASDCEVITIE